MKKLWIIIVREFLSRVKKRSFLISTIGVPLLIIGFYALMIFIMAGGAGTSAKQIAVVDDSGYFHQKLSNKKKLYFSYPDASIEELKENPEYDGILHIPKIDIYKVNDNIKYYSSKSLGVASLEYLESELSSKIKELRMKDMEIDASVIKNLQVSLSVKELDYKDSSSGSDTPESKASRMLSLIGIVIGLSLYVILITFGTMVMKGVREEKTNRIVEVIISSVKPFQLMLGKIVGISMVGIVQAIIWGCLIYVGQFFLILLLPTIGVDFSGFSGMANTTDPQDLDGAEEMLYALANFDGWGKLAFAFIFYFIGGYFIYASLFSALASAIDDESDAQKMMFPVMFPIIISLFIVMMMAQEPNSTIAVIASIFPLTSPIVMPARIAFNPPLWQYILSMISLIAGAIFFIWISAKVYRTGILMYGKKITFKEIFKWLSY